MNACISACGCGCGQAIPVIRRWQGRQAPRFIKGHNFVNRRLDVRSYKEQGQKRLHRLRAEAALGKRLPTGAEVHHVDGTKSVYSPLVICQDKAYHKLLHVRTRVVRAGGDPDTQRVCGACGKPRNISEFYQRKTDGSRVSTCKSCCSMFRGPRPSCAKFTPEERQRRRREVAAAMHKDGRLRAPIPTHEQAVAAGMASGAARRARRRHG